MTGNPITALAADLRTRSLDYDNERSGSYARIVQAMTDAEAVADARAVAAKFV